MAEGFGLGPFGIEEPWGSVDIPPVITYEAIATVAIIKNKRSQILFRTAPPSTTRNIIAFDHEQTLNNNDFIINICEGGVHMRATSTSYFTLKRHDRRPILRMTVLQRSDGTPLDLTGASALFIMKDSDGTEIINSAAGIEAPTTSGVLTYDWQTGDTDVSGEYQAEFEIDYGAGDKLTIPNNGYLVIRIYDDLNNV